MRRSLKKYGKNLMKKSSDYRRLRIKCHTELVSVSNKINKSRDPEIILRFLRTGFRVTKTCPGEPLVRTCFGIVSG
jgi:hypothetical protein